MAITASIIIGLVIASLFKDNLRFINEHEINIAKHHENNELKRTETKSGKLSSYGVRTGSLLFFLYQITNSFEIQR